MDETAQPTAVRIPMLVKIISALYLVAGLFGIIGAIGVLLMGAQYGFLSPFAKFGTWGAIAVLIFSLITFFISQGLRKGKNWARRIAIVIGVVSIIMMFYNQGTVDKNNILQFAVNSLIVIYLLINRQVQIAFKR